MKTLVRKTFAVLGMIACSTIFAETAAAQCAGPQPSMQQQSWHGGRFSLRPVSFDDDHDDAGIVGFWNTVLTARGNVNGPPDGFLIDKGVQQWHADGTEFLNSSLQNPQTQNYCLGVWEKTGPSKYTLNHFAYGYDATGKVNGLNNIREEVVLGHDKHTFSGTFTIQGYDLLRNKVGALLRGVVNARRLTIQTKAADVL